MEDPVTGKLKAVAKNRKPRFEQSGPSLADLELTRQDISRLTVKKSQRYYNDTGRDLPGMEFFCNGERYIMSGRKNKGLYLLAKGQGKKEFMASECRIVKKNRGLVYLS